MAHRVAHRVAVWGPGNVGGPALRCVVAHPGLELASVLVHSEAKEGRDAGELVGLGATGVRATRSVDALLASAPDAVFYGATQDLRPREAWDDMCRLLEAGVTVVTAGLYGLLHPASAEPALRERFAGACRRGASRFLASGIDPGFLNDLLPLLLSGVCEEIGEIRMLENFDYTTYEVPEGVRALIGFGSPMDRTPAMLLPGVPTAVWGGALRALAEALELPLEDVREVIERHPLERDLDRGGERLARGTQGAFRFEVQAIAFGRPVLVVEHVTRIAPWTAPEWPAARGMGHHQVRVTGRPNLTLTLECEDERGDHVAGGNAAAAARLVNAIPWLLGQQPGLYSGADVPLLRGAGRVRREEGAASGVSPRFTK